MCSLLNDGAVRATLCHEGSFKLILSSDRSPKPGTTCSALVSVKVPGFCKRWFRSVRVSLKERKALRA